MGQAYELTVSGPPKPSFRELADAFHREHERTYGHRSATDPVQLVNVRLAVRLPTPALAVRFEPAAPFARRDREVFFDGGAEKTPVIGRGRSRFDRLRAGPFVIEEYDCTCVVPPGYSARRDETDTVEIVAGAAA